MTSSPLERSRVLKAAPAWAVSVEESRTCHRGSIRQWLLPSHRVPNCLKWSVKRTAGTEVVWWHLINNVQKLVTRK